MFWRSVAMYPNRRNCSAGAAASAHVVLAVRNLEKGNLALARIVAAHPKADVTLRTGLTPGAGRARPMDMSPLRPRRLCPKSATAA